MKFSLPQMEKWICLNHGNGGGLWQLAATDDFKDLTGNRARNISQVKNDNKFL
jgi:hypothetical protein